MLYHVADFKTGARKIQITKQTNHNNKNKS